MRDDPRRRDPANYPWSIELQTRFADMDVNSHLNNVAFARFFEETRIRFGRALAATTPATPRPRYLVAHVAIDYLGEGSYPAPLMMTYAIGSIGRSSFRCLMGMFQSGAAVALCDSVLVHRGVDGDSALTDEMRARLEAFALKG